MAEKAVRAVSPALAKQQKTIKTKLGLSRIADFEHCQTKSVGTYWHTSFLKKILRQNKVILRLKTLKVYGQSVEFDPE